MLAARRTREEAEQLLYFKNVAEAQRLRASHRFLADTYRRNLYGGWRRENGELVVTPHYPAVLMHEQLKSPEVSVLLVGGGNRSGKSYCGLSEFCSWILGERPWDGSPTAPKGSGRHWVLAGVSHAAAFPTILCPYFEARMAHRIIRKVKNAQNQVRFYEVRSSAGGIDFVHCMSYEQHNNSGANNTSPFEGPTVYGAYFDEGMPKGAWTAIRRGLLTTRAAGWGKVLIAATPISQPWIYNDIYLRAKNLGGDASHIHYVLFTVYDNPYNTPQAIEETIADYPPEEREARIWGRYSSLAGRVYDVFDEHLHVYDPTKFNPLVIAGKDPGVPGAWNMDALRDWPVVCVMDPHDRRPPFISWKAISPEGWAYTFREYPWGEPYHRIRSKRAWEASFDDWAEIIRGAEEQMPGGSSRVLWRIMDPNSGPSAKSGIYQSIQEEMAERGLFFDTEVNDELRLGHAAVSARLRLPDPNAPPSPINSPRLFTSDECINTIFGYKNYTRKEHSQSDDDKGPSERVRDIGKDPMDCDRYYAVLDPPYIPWKGRSQDAHEYAKQLEAEYGQSGIG